MPVGSAFSIRTNLHSHSHEWASAWDPFSAEKSNTVHSFLFPFLVL